MKIFSWMSDWADKLDIPVWVMLGIIIVVVGGLVLLAFGGCPTM